jgi:hypothetical protein
MNCPTCAALTAENKELKEERDVYLKCILSMDKEWRRLLDLLEKVKIGNQTREGAPGGISGE